nr:MAG TPA: hypothetical protein [Caudoviricetes sp.]
MVQIIFIRKVLSLHTILIVEFLHLRQIKTTLANGKKELFGNQNSHMFLIANCSLQIMA